MSTARKVFSNTLAQVVAKLTVSVLGIAVIKIATNYLSLEGYGEYLGVYEFLAFFAIAADLGLFTIAVKEMSANEDKVEKIIGNVLSLRTILIFTTMGLAIATAFLIPNFEGSRIPLGIAIASVSVLITILNGTITSVLQAKLKMQWASFTSVLGKLVSVSGMVYVVFYGFPNDTQTGFYMLLVAGILGNLVMLIGTGLFVRKIATVRPQFDLSFWKEILVKSLPYGIALILNTIYFRLDSMLILFIKGEEELSVYGVGMKMLEHLTIIPLYFMNSVLPVLSRTIKEKSSKYKDVIKYSFDFLAMLSVPIVVGGVILAFPIIFIISAPEYLSRLSEGFLGSDIAFQILVFALLFQFLNVLFAFILIAVDQQKKLLLINAICVAFNLITNIIFIPIYGFVGAAVTSVLSELCILISTYIAAKRVVDFQISFKNLGKIVFSALVMGAAIYFLQKPTYELVQNWNILLLIPLGMLIYTAMLFATKTVDKNILKLLKKGEATPHDGNGPPLT